MTNSTDESSRLDGTLELNPDFEQRQPYSSLLPVDFPKRLERLKEASGLTWSGLAGAIGVDCRCTGGARVSSRPAEPCTPSTCSQPAYPAGWRSSWARGSS